MATCKGTCSVSLIEKNYTSEYEGFPMIRVAVISTVRITTMKFLSYIVMKCHSKRCFSYKIHETYDWQSTRVICKAKHFQIFLFCPTSYFLELTVCTFHLQGTEVVLVKDKKRNKKSM